MAYVEIGRLHDAAEDFLASTHPQSPTPNPTVLFTRLAAGELDRYRKEAAAWLQSGIGDAGNIEYHVGPLMLVSGIDLGTVVPMLEAVHAKSAHYYTALYLGAACYRLGRFDDAVKNLTFADLNYRHEPTTLYFLAMAQQRHGKAEDAKATLIRARKLVSEQKSPRWEKRIEWKALDREADQR